MAFVIFELLIVSFLFQTTSALWLQSALYRHQNNGFSYGNFRTDLYHHLEVTKITSSSVDDQFDCLFKCIGEPKCYSYNLAASPDPNGLYMCELLASNKYNATANALKPSANIHHYSPWVSELKLQYLNTYFC